MRIHFLMVIRSIATDYLQEEDFFAKRNLNRVYLTEERMTVCLNAIIVIYRFRGIYGMSEKWCITTLRPKPWEKCPEWAIIQCQTHSFRPYRLIHRTPEVRKLLSVDLTIVYSLISFPRVMVIEVSHNHKMYASIMKLKYDKLYLYYIVQGLGLGFRSAKKSVLKIEPVSFWCF